MTTPDHTIDLEATLGSAPFGRTTLLVCALCTAALILDGFDIQAIAFVAPRLISQWHISKSDLASVLAAGFIAMGLGAVTLGATGDRIGRRRALVISVALLAIGSLLCATSNSLGSLATFRFVTGLGLGGALPNAAALMIEFAPLRTRNIAMAVTIVGVPAGGMLGAFIASMIEPQFGWPSVFLAGGALPIVLLAFLGALLPESPSFLAHRDPSHPALSSLVQRVTGRAFDGNTRWIMPATTTRPGLGALFVGAYRYNTLVIWTIFFANLLAVYSIFNWIPTLLTGAGLPLSAALQGAFAFNLGGVVGAIAGAYAMNAYGSRPVMIALASLAVVSTFMLGQIAIGHDVPRLGLMALMFIAGGCINGQQIQMFTVAGNAYPTTIRAFGVGAGLASARVGGIASSFAGSLLATFGGGLTTFFAGIAALMLLVLAGVLALRCHLQPIGRH
jgi:AAHS family 4-hydroxybenzoate transporter-like MFS transporter